MAPLISGGPSIMLPKVNNATDSIKRQHGHKNERLGTIPLCLDAMK
jgi:hypothetical protein